MKKKRLVTLMGSICLVLVLVALLLPACAKEEAPVAPAPAAKPIVWKFAGYGSMASPWNYLPKWFFDEVDKRSGGRLKVEMYVGEALVKIADMPEAVKSGLCQLNCTNPAYYTDLFPYTSLWCEAFVLPNSASKQAVRDTFTLVDKYAQHPTIVEEWARIDHMFLMPHGFTQNEMFSNKPFRTVADLKGLKTRTYYGYVPILKHFGGVPVWVSTTECYGALQKGVVDATIHGAYMGKAYKWFEVSKYFTDDLQFGNSMGYMAVKKSAYDGLPEDLKKVIMEVKKDALIHFPDEYVLKEAEGREYGKELGVEFIYLPEEERAKLVAVAPGTAWKECIDKLEEKGLTEGKEILDWMIKLDRDMGYD